MPNLNRRIARNAQRKGYENIGSGVPRPHADSYMKVHMGTFQLGGTAGKPETHAPERHYVRRKQLRGADYAACYKTV